MTTDTRAALAQALEPVAYLYTLEYGSTVVNTVVSIERRRYPFGVCGADYLRANDDGVSYVRETALYAAPARQPLTDKNISDLLERSKAQVNPLESAAHVFARAVERAHGIG